MIKPAQFTDVTYAVEEGAFAVITINRPERYNAFRGRTVEELIRAFRSAWADRQVQAVILTGAGEKAFCTGGDVKQRAETGDYGPTESGMFEIGYLHKLIRDIPKPVIAAVNGAAVGWGMELALMADIRIASERAKFGELFVLRGLCTDVAGIGRLAHVVGRDAAARLLFTGDVVDAETARRLGLVSDVVAHDELLPTAMELATKIAARPPLAVAKIKEGLRRALDPDWTELGIWVSMSLSELFRTEDHREGVAAFLERRPPEFTGR